MVTFTYRALWGRMTRNPNLGNPRHADCLALVGPTFAPLAGPINRLRALRGA